MKFYPDTLLSYYRKTEMTAELKRKLMVQILFGVSTIHSENLAHNDLKLENIMVSKSGVPKIADFGLAGPTFSQYAMGTKSYAAPEMFSSRRQAG